MANYDSGFTGVQIDAALTKANSATQPGDLATVATSGGYDDLTGTPTTIAGYGITDAQPLATALTNTTAAFTTAAASAIEDNTAKDTNATHTGDATGATELTLATVNGNVGSFGIAASVAQITVNAKGLVTAALNVAVSVASSAINDSTAAGRAFLTAATAAAQRTLLNVADGATANASDAALRDRSTHTGTQAVGTITGLGTAATTAATDYATAAQGALAVSAVQSDVTGVTGADAVVNIISLTQAEYDAIGTPNSATIYAITDA